MIRVKVKRQSGRWQELETSGHAQQAPRGEDLVCAGVSSILIGALNALNQLVPDACDLLMEEAHVKISVKKDSGQVQLLLDSLLIQLQTMEAAYADYIQITVQEV